MKKLSPRREDILRAIAREEVYYGVMSGEAYRKGQPLKVSGIVNYLSNQHKPALVYLDPATSTRRFRYPYKLTHAGCDYLAEHPEQ